MSYMQLGAIGGRYTINPFSVLEQPTQLMLGNARGAVEVAEGAHGRDFPLVVGIQSAKVEARDAKILTDVPDHMGPVEVNNRTLWNVMNSLSTACKSHL